ncbi:MAG TPA: hypothetical protein VK563_20405 [Puia sp.]|nr:hypothetical protein [Puia sp.]
MTKSDLDYLSIFCAIAFFLIPAWELITNKTEKGLKRITPLGWVSFGVTVIFGIIAFASIKIGDKEKREATKLAEINRNADKKEIVAAFQAELKNYNLHYDSFTRKVEVIKVDSSNYYGVPNISPMRDQDIGIKYSPNKDHILVHINLNNISKTDAYNFEIHISSLAIFDTANYFTVKEYTLDSGSKIPVHVGITFDPSCNMTNMHGAIVDTFFLYIRSYYTNYYGRGKNTYIEMFEWTPNDASPSIPDPKTKARIKNILGIN